MNKEKLLHNLRGMNKQILDLSVSDLLDDDISTHILRLRENLDKINYFFANKSISKLVNTKAIIELEAFKKALIDTEKIIKALRKRVK